MSEFALRSSQSLATALSEKRNETPTWCPRPLCTLSVDIGTLFDPPDNESHSLKTRDFSRSSCDDVQSGFVRGVHSANSVRR